MYFASSPVVPSARATEAESPSSLATIHGDERTYKLAGEARRSVRYCCGMCLLSVLADAFASLARGDLRSEFRGPDVFDNTSMLAFSAGLWRMSRLYWEGRGDMDKRLTEGELLALYRTMGWMWGIVSLDLALAAAATAATLPGRCVDGPLRLLCGETSPGRSMIVAVGIFVVGGAVARRKCVRAARSELAAYEGRAPAGGDPDCRRALPRLDAIRDAGFRAYFHQALGAWSFALVACVRLSAWLASFRGRGISSIIGHLCSVFDFLTPFIISRHVFVLNKVMVRASIAEVMGNVMMVRDDKKVYDELFVAQIGFYQKAAETLKASMIFQFVLAPLAWNISKALSLTS